MTFTEMALRMFPYWIMGILTMIAVYNSEYRKLLRVEVKPLMKWILFLAVVTIYRIAVFHFLKGNDKLHNMTEGAMMIPWQATLTVFWEDACHGLPLAILGLALGNDKLWKKLLTWLAIFIVTVSFGLGHVYQGWIAATFLSLYIPFTLKRGKEIGFGTIMICHTLYDLATILTVKTFLG